MELYDKTTFDCSKLITRQYSTSFSLGIRMLDKKYHRAIYAIYGFVRYADEIVDTFHQHDKQWLLQHFKTETFEAIGRQASLNPVLHAFQRVVNEYGIGHDLITAFLHSMEMDLTEHRYDEEKYKTYIYGSAEVVGLMCLCVFCEGNKEKYEKLRPYACRLGAAFQKVNFLRDLKSDYAERGRVYFPGVDPARFQFSHKILIEKDIEADFDAAYPGILQLPKGARLGVYVAYIYYLALFKKIRNLPPSSVLNGRVRIPGNRKFVLLVQTYLRYRFNGF